MSEKFSVSIVEIHGYCSGSMSVKRQVIVFMVLFSVVFRCETQGFHVAVHLDVTIGACIC